MKLIFCSVNEVFNPEKVDDIFAQEASLRADALNSDKATNYGVVRLELLEKIYEEMYSYKIQYSSEEQWPHRILNHRSVTGMRDVTIDGKPQVQLEIENSSGQYTVNKVSRQETVTADLIIVATGYLRNSHEEMLSSLRHLSPSSKGWAVNRDYAVEFTPNSVQKDAGIWLQGCNEKTHGLSDSLLSILAIRGGELVESIFGYQSQRKHAGI